jgi:Uma2 family endonuclease
MLEPPLQHKTIADMLDGLGGVSPQRVHAVPPPGTATEKDLLNLAAHTGLACELIDGVLVEKAMGYYESMLAGLLIRLLGDFVEQHDLGIVLGEGGTLRILPDQVRVPDVCFIGWDRFPERRLPEEPVPAVAPDLAVEILSESNTEAEMRRKLDDYFAGGVRLVWYIDPASKSAEVYTSADLQFVIKGDDTLDGGDVLPGFRVSLGELFRRAGSPRSGPEQV